MNGEAWLNSLPNKSGPERDQFTLKAVEDGLAVCKWVAITSTYKDQTGTFYVSDDAVRVELPGNYRFRFQVSAKLAQQCVDILNVSFITTKLSDLAYKQAQIVIPAITLKPGADMDTTTKSKQWNDLVEKKRAGKEGLFRDCGKAWILDNNLKFSSGAINYGFYDPGAPYVGAGGLKMWQGGLHGGGKHNASHQDYSQTLIVVRKDCLVNGKYVDIMDVANDPIMSYLINYDGILKYTRQP
jgi:hypothetical protein